MSDQQESDQFPLNPLLVPYEAGMKLLQGEDRVLIPPELRVEIQELLNTITARRVRIKSQQGWDLLDPPADLAAAAHDHHVALGNLHMELAELVEDEAAARRIVGGDCYTYEESQWDEKFMLWREQLQEPERELLLVWIAGEKFLHLLGKAKEAIKGRLDTWYGWRDSDEGSAIAQFVQQSYEHSLQQDPDVTELELLVYGQLPAHLFDTWLDPLCHYVVPVQPDQPYPVRISDRDADSPEALPLFEKCSQLLAKIAHRHTQLLWGQHPELRARIPAPTREDLGCFLRQPLWDAIRATWQTQTQPSSLAQA